MLNLWKWSTLALLLQVVVGSLSLFATGNAIVIANVIAIVTFVVGLSLPIERHDMARVFFIAAVAVVGASRLAFGGSVLLIAIAVVFVVIVSLFSVREALYDGAPEGVLPLYVAVLPLGIGTFIGGPILLYQWQRGHASTSR